MKLLILFLVSLLLTIALSAPANCGDRSNGNGLSIDQVDEEILEAKPQFFKLKKLFGVISGLKKTNWGFKVHQCYDKNVCQVDCSKIVPGCKKTEETLEVNPTTDPEDINVYNRVCIERVYEDPKSSQFFNGGLLTSIKMLYPKFSLPNQYTSWKQFEDMVAADENLRKTAEFDGIMSLIHWAKLYRAYYKVCQTNADWADKLDQKIDSFESSAVAGEFALLGETRAKAKAEENKFLAKFPKRNGFGFAVMIANMMANHAKNRFHHAKGNLRNNYKDRVKTSSPPLCQCAGFDNHYNYATNWNKVFAGKKLKIFGITLFTWPRMSTPNYLDNIYPPRKNAAVAYCQRVCK